MADDTNVLPHGWEVDFDISAAKYRVLTQIPQGRLTKPIEVALIEEKKEEKWIRYKAIHFLPTLGKHPQFIAIGSSEREALDGLARSLSNHFISLQGTPKEHMHEDSKMILQYLESLITTYRTE